MLTLTRVPLARLTRSPRGWLPVVGWSALAIASALLVGQKAGADRALLGIFAPFVLPLVAYGLVAAAFGGKRVGDAGAPLRAFGASPTQTALAGAFVAILASAIAGAVLAVVLVAIGHGPLDAPFGHDASTSAWIGALGGASYASLFSAGACFGPRGSGRSAVLVGNWLLGSGHGVGAIVVPYGHVRSLLGGEPVLAWSQRGSSIALVVIMLFALGVVAWRGRK
ncbi:hypothetical protein BH09MYX1_BH09MYX1_39090 [soil metagenome]